MGPWFPEGRAKKRQRKKIGVLLIRRGMTPGGQSSICTPTKKRQPDLGSEDPCRMLGQYKSVMWKENVPVMRTGWLSLFHLLQQI